MKIEITDVTSLKRLNEIKAKHKITQDRDIILFLLGFYNRYKVVDDYESLKLPNKKVNISSDPLIILILKFLQANTIKPDKKITVAISDNKIFQGLKSNCKDNKDILSFSIATIRRRREALERDKYIIPVKRLGQGGKLYELNFEWEE